MLVKKRNGGVEKFHLSKIISAVRKAYQSSNIEELPKDVENSIKAYFQLYTAEHKEINVEDIQDQIELLLMKANGKVAKAFIIYRFKHAEDREIAKRVTYMQNYQTNDKNAASSSATDPNANMNIKNVSNMESEVYKPTNRRTQRYMTYNSIKAQYGEKMADSYLNDLANHIIYTHDEASTPVIKNYCEAVSLYPLIFGTNSLDGTGVKPPKNLDAFCGQLINATFLLAGQCKGACAFGEFFNFFDYFCAKDFGDDYDLKLDLYADTDAVINRKTIKQRIEQKFQQVVHNWNQPAGNRGSQSPFTNISYYDSNYWKALFSEFTFPDGKKPVWRRIDKLQKQFMRWFNEERTHTLLTFPVETMALLTDGKNVIDKDYEQFTAEMYHEGHSFFTYLSDNPNSLSSCCRLRNQITDNVFSFTNGLTGVQTGSCNVITMNLNRITQNWFNETYGKDVSIDKRNEIIKSEEGNNSFKKYIEAIVKRIHKYHIGYKSMLYTWEANGMFTASNAGYIKMNKLFSTIGLNGINEAAEFFGIKPSYNEDYKNFCNIITTVISSCNKEESTKKYQFNTEFVPAESLSSKNYKWDKADGYIVPLSRNLYNSYFYLASDKDTTVLDRFRMHGREFTEKLDGGVGLHCNLDEHLSKEQYLKLIRFSIKVGCSYFTFNVINTQCDDCGFIAKHKFDVCPKCGSTNTTDWTRIIGYLRPIKKFDDERYIESKSRIYDGKFGWS